MITVIPRPGLPGGVDMRPDPFLAGPEMEQVAVLRLEEPEMQPQQQQQQQMLVQQQQQLQAVQQQQKQQQPSGSDQQRQQFKASFAIVKKSRGNFFIVFRWSQRMYSNNK